MRRFSGRGFNVVELVIVIAVFVVMVAASIPVFTAFKSNRILEGAESQVGNDLRNAQSMAVTRGGLVRLHWGSDPAVNLVGQYRLEQSTNGGTTWSALGQWVVLSNAYSGSSITNLKSNTSITAYEVRFNDQGALANPGNVNYPLNLTVATSTGSKVISIYLNGYIKLP